MIQKLHIYLFIACLSLFSISPAIAEDVKFISAIEDLPLKPGFVENIDSTLIFDKLSGRIVEASAEGTASQMQTIHFYNKTLPQLGWVNISTGKFRRADEVLTMKFESVSDTTIVHFSLSPKK